MERPTADETEWPREKFATPDTVTQELKRMSSDNLKNELQTIGDYSRENVLMHVAYWHIKVYTTYKTTILNFIGSKAPVDAAAAKAKALLRRKTLEDLQKSLQLAEDRFVVTHGMERDAPAFQIVARHSVIVARLAELSIVTDEQANAVLFDFIKTNLYARHKADTLMGSATNTVNGKKGTATANSQNVTDVWLLALVLWQHYPTVLDVLDMHRLESDAMNREQGAGNMANAIPDRRFGFLAQAFFHQLVFYDLLTGEQAKKRLEVTPKDDRYVLNLLRLCFDRPGHFEMLQWQIMGEGVTIKTFDITGTEAETKDLKKMLDLFLYGLASGKKTTFILNEEKINLVIRCRACGGLARTTQSDGLLFCNRFCQWTYHSQLSAF